MSGVQAIRKPQEAVGLPLKMAFWRVLIEIEEPPEKTEGGIFLPDEVRNAEAVMSCVGRIADMGPLAFTARTSLGYDYGAMHVRPQIGDFVLVPKYGSRDVRLKDGRSYKILEDHEVLAVVTEPEEVVAYVNT